MLDKNAAKIKKAQKDLLTFELFLYALIFLNIRPHIVILLKILVQGYKNCVNCMNDIQYSLETEHIAQSHTQGDKIENCFLFNSS